MTVLNDLNRFHLVMDTNWVRLGTVDLFFFITAGSKGRRKGLETGLSLPRWLCVN